MCGVELRPVDMLANLIEADHSKPDVAILIVPSVCAAERQKRRQAKFLGNGTCPMGGRARDIALTAPAGNFSQNPMRPGLNPFFGIALEFLKYHLRQGFRLIELEITTRCPDEGEAMAHGL